MPLSASDRQKLIDRITDPSPSKSFKIVLYGVPGTRKTTTAATLGERNLLIMTETGDNVLTKAEHKDLFERTKRVPFTSLKGVRGYLEMLEDGTLDYSHLIIDNMSGLQDKKLSENMEDPGIKNNSKISRIHPDLSTLQDYQIVAHQMRPTIVETMDLEKDVTVICHFRPADPDHNEFHARPDVTKAIYNLLNEKANVIAYFYKNNQGAVMVRTLGNGQFIAKSQITDEVNSMPVEEFIRQVKQWKSTQTS